MLERYSFPVRFEDADMRAAVNAFTWRALVAEHPWRMGAPLVLIALCCGGLAYIGEGEDAAMLFFGCFILLGLFVAGGWRMHQRMMHEKVEKARGHLCTARLSDEGVVIDAGGQGEGQGAGLRGEAPLLPWKSIKAIWPGERVWLLIVATNHFVALPIARAPREALEFMQTRVGGLGMP